MQRKWPIVPARARSAVSRFRSDGRAGTQLHYLRMLDVFRHHRTSWCGVVLALAGLSAAAGAARADVSGDDVKRAIARAVRFVKREQAGDGQWKGRYYPGGETCLATFALLQAGERADSPVLAAALGEVRKLPLQHTYVVALKAQVLALAGPREYQPEIEAAARWLIKAQLESGLWSYTQQPAAFDHSNSQFALLGLHAAAQAGVKIPPGVWQRARTRVLSSQNRDGGWAYRENGKSYGSMTAANVANLAILGSPLIAPAEDDFENGAAANCGVTRLNRPLANGLTWLGRQFSVETNPQQGRNYLYYWLYAVERAGILTGQQRFGAHDWYRAGAEALVREQQLDGSWERDVVQTCFGLLFLAKGHKPLLIQKLQWSSDERWSPDVADIDNLVAFIGDKLGEPTAWQVVPFDAPLADWLAAPLLYLQGHEFPAWNDAQRRKVQQYVQQGGTLLAEACCGRAEFRTGFEQFVAAAFPGQPLRELDAGHPVYSSHYDLEPSGMHGVDVGCRTSILYSPRDLSCLWQQARVPLLSERAFKLGTNIAAYATGRQSLRDRLDIRVVPTAERLAGGPPREDALRLAQVVYDGDWQPDPQALVRLAELLRDQAHVKVITQYRPVRLTDSELVNHPILYLTGHFGFALTPAERAALAGHLRRGGFLIADACCGREAFDASFRALLRDALPGESLAPLPPDHPIFRGAPGFRIEQVGYKSAAGRTSATDRAIAIGQASAVGQDSAVGLNSAGRRESAAGRESAVGQESAGPGATTQPHKGAPVLLGVSVEGRLAVVYSPFALGCGFDGHTCYDCRGVVNEDARRIGVNIVLYALTQ